ncbi:MAG: hypothetical protein KGL39_20200 [Patescibacteria group bacterium]|nr:hypothetical protein [Patescibacteria group bacterium]
MSGGFDWPKKLGHLPKISADNFVRPLTFLPRDFRGVRHAERYVPMHENPLLNATRTDMIERLIICPLFVAAFVACVIAGALYGVQ